MINKRSIKKIMAALIGIGVVVVGFSGTRDDSFIRPLRDAIVAQLAAENPQPIVLADLTEFEWDHVDIFHGGHSVFDVWDRGIPWFGFSFVHKSFSGHHLWVFRKDGLVTRYANVVSHFESDPDNPIQYIPRVAQYFDSLSRDEAVFNFISLDDTLRLDWRHDFLFPIASSHPANSWRGVFQECIERTFFYDSCAKLAREKYPYKSSEDWPR